MNWTVEQVLALAPDASSAKSGRELGVPKKWVSLGKQEQILWGECQGSGKDPYQTQIDVTEPTFKCSCPSRKFPCKHGLGLFLICVQQEKAMTQTTLPKWVDEWIESRKKRIEKKIQKEQEAQDPEVQVKRAAEQAKRAAKRETRVQEGIEELQRFLFDLIRQGIATLPTKDYDFFDTPAARLVDAQAPGLARFVRELGEVVSSGEGWQERFLTKAGFLHLLVKGYEHIEKLSAELQADVRSLLGFSVSQEEVLAQSGTRAVWSIVGQVIEEEDRLRAQRIWLWDEKKKKAAMILQFVVAGQPLDVSLLPGRTIEGEVVYFPGSYKMRALLKTRDQGGTITSLSGYSTVEEVLSAYASALSLNPWTIRIPASLEKMIPDYDGTQLLFYDQKGFCVKASLPDLDAWRVMAISAGEPISIFGEWNGTTLRPLGLWSDSQKKWISFGG